MSELNTFLMAIVGHYEKINSIHASLELPKAKQRLNILSAKRGYMEIRIKRKPWAAHLLAIARRRPY
jgi:hypothetical protein